MSLIDIKEAAGIIGVSIVTARKLLGDPERTERSKYNLPRFLYERSAVEKAAQSRNKPKSNCETCRRCRIVCQKGEIINGRCPQCRADLCILHFCGLTRCPCKEADPKMILCLKRAIEKAEGQYEK